MGTLKFILGARLKRSTKTARKVGGFTLIELLVGLILAFLILTPLLGFMINILNTDRQEQAKVNSEQDLQAAMDYISRDLQQAVYIYDQYALDHNNDSTPNSTTSGIKDQLPQVTNAAPVLVFWKRKFVPKSVPTATSGQPNDSFVYSLVAYYLISTPGAATAKIGRFEIHDGVKKPDNTYVDENSTDSSIARDKGFQSFTVQSSGNLAQSMNQWQKKTGETYDKSPTDLVEYIDNSPTTVTTAVPGNPIPVEPCPTDLDPTTTLPQWTQVPSTSQTYSFYSCVWSATNTGEVKNTARVYIRGNALARIRNTNNNYIKSLSAFFPRTRIEVKSRATLGTNSGG